MHIDYVANGLFGATGHFSCKRATPVLKLVTARYWSVLAITPNRLSRADLLLTMFFNARTSEFYNTYTKVKDDWQVEQQEDPSNNIDAE